MKRRKQTTLASTIVGILLLGLLLICSEAQQLVNEAATLERQMATIESELDQTPDLPVLEPGGGEWYELYFTTPIYPDRPENRPAETPPIVAGLLEAINSSQQTLDIAIYELNLPELGEAILAARERGVQVRLVTDTDEIEELEVLIELHEAGLPMVEDDRSAIMHNKFVVVDGQAVWTGSWNFTPNGTYRNNNHAIYIQSPQLAQSYTTEFEEMFTQQSFGPRSPENSPQTPLNVNGTPIEVCFAPEDECGTRIGEVVGTATESIHFMAFSFTHDDIGMVMADKVERGVTVRGIFENRGSNTQYSEFGRLQEAGADVVQDGNPYTMHHKAIIIDGETTILGSFNFSQNADSSNDENILIIDNPQIASQFISEFERLYQVALNPPNE